MPAIATPAEVAERRGRDHDHADARDVHAQRTRFVVRQREQVHAPAQEHQRHEGRRDERQRQNEIARQHAEKLPRSQNVIAGSWL
jgi:hypothetical protein